jgi:HTH-type transcriptional regulator/antitoxin HigA
MRVSTPDRRTPDTYFALVRALPLRPIHSEDQLDKATATLLKLVKSKPEEAMDAGERDYVEALSMLILRYEQGRRDSALPKLSPLDRLKFLMGEQAMSVNGLGRVIGSQPSASLILRGKRSMSKAQILKIARHFDVTPALFL